MKTDIFQSCGHCWVFQICWHIEFSIFTAWSSRIWNSSTGIPSPPLALFIVMLAKAHLTSHSRASGSRWVWVITPLLLSRSWRSFLYSSSVYSCHLFLIYSASVRSYHFCSLLCPFLHEMYPCYLPIFSKRSPVFSILLFFSISLHCSLKKVFLSLCCSLELCIHLGISFPFSFAFCFPNTKLENIKRHRNFRNKKITVLKA